MSSLFSNKVILQAFIGPLMMLWTAPATGI